MNMNLKLLPFFSSSIFVVFPGRLLGWPCCSSPSSPCWTCWPWRCCCYCYCCCCYKNSGVSSSRFFLVACYSRDCCCCCCCCDETFVCCVFTTLVFLVCLVLLLLLLLSESHSLPKLSFTETKEGRGGASGNILGKKVRPYITTK